MQTRSKDRDVIIIDDSDDGNGDDDNDDNGSDSGSTVSSHADDEVITTKEGLRFVETPLDKYAAPEVGVLGLPGLDEDATEKLAAVGITSGWALLGQYIAMQRNDDLFLHYLKEVLKIKFVSAGKVPPEVLEHALVSALRAKWHIIREY